MLQIIKSRMTLVVFLICWLCFFLPEVKAQDTLIVNDSSKSAGITFQPMVKLLIIQKKCDCNGGFISMGDGIASCINCGRSFIYDSTLFFRPLHIFSNDSMGIGTCGYKDDLHITNEKTKTLKMQGKK